MAGQLEHFKVRGEILQTKHYQSSFLQRSDHYASLYAWNWSQLPSSASYRYVFRIKHLQLHDQSVDPAA